MEARSFVKVKMEKEVPEKKTIGELYVDSLFTDDSMMLKIEEWWIGRAEREVESMV